MNNFGGIAEKLQQAKQQISQAKQELANKEFVGEAGAGMVKVIVSGDKKVKKITIEDKILSESKEMLEDLVVAAVNVALEKASQGDDSSEVMLSLAKDLGIDKILPFGKF